ncbi:hypothetical protein [Rhizobium sp. 21-4511-3d]
MHDPFIKMLSDMVRTARLETKGPGGLSSVKQILGDVHGRFMEVTKPFGFARPLPKELSDTWVNQLEKQKHWSTRQRLFHEDEIATLRRFQTAYYRQQETETDLTSPFSFLYPSAARDKLGRHYGSQDFYRSSDDMIHAILAHPVGPFALRADGRGHEALELLNCFLRLVLTKEAVRKFGNELVQIDAALLGAMSWTISQYTDQRFLEILLPIVERNQDDSFFFHYPNFIWKGYRDRSCDEPLKWLELARSGLRTKVTSYGSSDHLDSGTLYNAARRASKIFGPLDTNHNLLGGKSVIDIFDEAIRFDENATSKCVFAYEDMGTAEIGKALVYSEHGLFDKAHEALARADLALSKGGFKLRIGQALAHKARILEAEDVSNGNLHFDRREVQDLKKAAMRLWAEMGQPDGFVI